MMTPHTWPIYGHDWAVDHLRKGITNQRIRHAYLIVGTEHIGRETLARAFAQAVNCTHENLQDRPCGQCRPCKLIASGNHPDVLYSQLDPSTGALKIEEVRSITSRIALKPYEAAYRVAIFRDFEKARPQAQDALLKTLEEPPPQAILILIAPSADSLLPTITSRSQVLALRPVSLRIIREVLHERGAEPAPADLLARLSGGRLGWALQALADPTLLAQREQALDVLENVLLLNRARRFELAEDFSKDKLALFPLLELWQTYWRDVLLLCEGSQNMPANNDRREALDQLARQLSRDEALKALKATRELMTRLHLNINLRLALECMFLDYPGLAT